MSALNAGFLSYFVEVISVSCFRGVFLKKSNVKRQDSSNYKLSQYTPKQDVSFESQYENFNYIESNKQKHERNALRRNSDDHSVYENNISPIRRYVNNNFNQRKSQRKLVGKETSSDKDNVMKSNKLRNNFNNLIFNGNTKRKYCHDHETDTFFEETKQRKTLKKQKLSKENKK